jgi:hypothetical protein
LVPLHGRCSAAAVSRSAAPCTRPEVMTKLLLLYQISATRGLYAPPGKESRLSSTTSISTRVHAQIASTVSFALGLPATDVQALSVQEMLVLCQQNGFEVASQPESPPT